MKFVPEQWTNTFIYHIRANGELADIIKQYFGMPMPDMPKPVSPAPRPVRVAEPVFNIRGLSGNAGPALFASTLRAPAFVASRSR